MFSIYISLIRVTKGFLNLFLHWVFTAEHKFSLVVTSGGYSLIAVCGFLIAMTSVVAEHQLQSSGSVTAHGLSCPAACGIFLDQGWNP